MFLEGHFYIKNLGTPNFLRALGCSLVRVSLISCIWGPVSKGKRGKGNKMGREGAVADPAMGGQGGRPPTIDQNLGLALVARLRHGGKFSL